MLEYWDGSALTYGVDSRGIVAIEAQMSRDIKGHVCAECGAALDKTSERCDCFMHPTEGMVCIAIRDWSEEDIFRTGERLYASMRLRGGWGAADVIDVAVMEGKL